MEIHDKVIGYMQEKKRQIDAILVSKGMALTTITDYFTEEDAAAIRKMDSSQLCQFLDRVGRDRTDSTNCPFCVVTSLNDKDCEECSYAQRHGVCADSVDTYSVLRNIIATDITDALDWSCFVL